MPFGIQTLKDLLELISYIVTSISLILIFITYFFSKRQIHFNTIEKCITDFRNMQDNQENLPIEKRISKYIDLVNEELFYIENGYLPKEVAIEWIDGMIDYLPFITANAFIPSLKFENLNNSEEIKKYLADFPRIKKFISISDPIIFDYIHLGVNSHQSDELMRYKERNKLISQLISNLKINRIQRKFYKIKINNR